MCTVISLAVFIASLSSGELIEGEGLRLVCIGLANRCFPLPFREHSSGSVLLNADFVNIGPVDFGLPAPASESKVTAWFLWEIRARNRALAEFVEPKAEKPASSSIAKVILGRKGSKKAVKGGFSYFSEEYIEQCMISIIRMLIFYNFSLYLDLCVFVTDKRELFLAQTVLFPFHFPLLAISLFYFQPKADNMGNCSSVLLGCEKHEKAQPPSTEASLSTSPKATSPAVTALGLQEGASVYQARKVLKALKRAKALMGKPGVDVCGQLVYPLEGLEWDSCSEAEGLYTGQTSKGVRTGFGTMKWTNGRLYEGNWQANLQHGLGRLLNTDRSSYEGQWRNGLRHGQGTYRSADGSYYTGDWAEDKQHGRGKEVWSDGQCYTGEYIAGFRSGHGQLDFPDLSSYTGDFRGNQLHGCGTFCWPDGRSYIGQWAHNKMQGRGKMTWKDGQSYEGEYKEDCKEGLGVFCWPDGRRYEGPWKSGKQHGVGSFTDTLGRTRQGEWSEGRRLHWL